MTEMQGIESPQDPVAGIISREMIGKAIDDLWRGTGKYCPFCGHPNPPVSYTGLIQMLSGDM